MGRVRFDSLESLITIDSLESLMLAYLSTSVRDRWLGALS